MKAKPKIETVEKLTPKPTSVLTGSTLPALGTVQLLEQSELAETLVLSMALLENQPTVKLQVLQTLQMLSSSSDVKWSLMLKAQRAQQICFQGCVVLTLLHLVKPSAAPLRASHDHATGPPVQQEELQLQALAALATVAPLMLDDYMTCQGNTSAAAGVVC
ncbi:hypothetical protein J4Q44_G00035480 [Coregonus suidteri]|uniref:Cilia- and flagella-associated protein 69 ARM repeats domain-containing protein n=1 Tax=Coregonus suidteri TaxID=861788 RepID=A0AAN8MLM7_9TELE